MGISNIHILQYLNLEFFQKIKHIVSSETWIINLQIFTSTLYPITTEPVDISRKWFLYNLSQQEGTDWYC